MSALVDPFFGNPASHVISASLIQHAGTSTNYSFSGMSSGELAFILMNTAVASPPTTPTGWTAITCNWSMPNSYGQVMYWKGLTSTDITAGSLTISTSSNGFSVFGHLNAGTSMALKSQTDSASGTSTLDIAGFVKGVGALDELVFCFDRGKGAFAAPAGLNVILNHAAATFFTATLGEYSPAGLYANSTAIHFSSLATSDQHDGLVFEVT